MKDVKITEKVARIIKIDAEMSRDRGAVLPNAKMASTAFISQKSISAKSNESAKGREKKQVLLSKFKSSNVVDHEKETDAHLKKLTTLNSS